LVSPKSLVFTLPALFAIDSFVTALTSAGNCSSVSIAKRAGSVKTRDFGLTKEEVRKSHEGISVLIVEDNLVNQKVLQKQLRNIGFEVVVANHGAEALERLKESCFWKGNFEKGVGVRLSVVLMDQEM